ncbi:MAG: LysR family transcriptional regulator [Alphaproteobacteria bacterium]|nr:LysR family transcriptional regulator [Alphaproteobacteria bacterium]
MDIQDLRIFERVAALQNLSAVGNEFSLTPGTISKRLQSLEDELGVRLFARSTRSIRITEEGRIFLEHAQRMLSEFEAAKASVDSNRGNPRGLIRLHSPARLRNQELAAGLCTFMAAYPEIDVQADISDRGGSVSDEGSDITIKAGALPDSSLIAKRLADDPMVIVAAPCYLDRAGTPATPQDLESHSCLVHGDLCHWPFWRKSSERSVRVAGRMRSNDVELLRKAACEGIGLIRVSEAYVAEDIQAGRLVPVLTNHDTSGDSAVWAIFPKSKNMLPRMRVFLDFLADWLKQPALARDEAPLFDLSRRSAAGQLTAPCAASNGKPANESNGKGAAAGRRAKISHQPRRGRSRPGASA